VSQRLIYLVVSPGENHDALGAEIRYLKRRGYRVACMGGSGSAKADETTVYPVARTRWQKFRDFFLDAPRKRP